MARPKTTPTPTPPKPPEPVPTAGQLASLIRTIQKDLLKYARDRKQKELAEFLETAGRDLGYAIDWRIGDAIVAQEWLREVGPLVEFVLGERKPRPDFGEPELIQYCENKVKELERQLLKGDLGYPNSTCPFRNVQTAMKPKAAAAIRDTFRSVAFHLAYARELEALPPETPVPPAERKRLAYEW